jgi:hypothetical protein
MFLKGEFSNRLVQVSLFAGIVYYITAYPVVFEKARKYFPVKFKKTHHLLIFHTFIFAVLMYLLTYFVFDPIVRVVEGAKDAGTAAPVAVPRSEGSEEGENTVPDCNVDSDCGEDYKCYEQMCVPTCDDDSNCGEGYRCGPQSMCVLEAIFGTDKKKN